MQTKIQTANIDSLEKEYDLVIVGSGATGLVSALQAKRLGLKVAVIEKMASLGGNTMRASSGMNAAETEVQLANGVIDDFTAFYQETLQGGGKLNDKELLEYFVTHAPLAIEWLAKQGIVLSDLTISGGMSQKRMHRPQSMAPIGAYLIKGLLARCVAEAIPLFADTKLVAIKKAAEKITGITVAGTDGKEVEVGVKALLLATGGFGANANLIAQYQPQLANYKTTNHAGASGDGLLLAQKLGAQLVDMNFIQVHPTVQQDFDHTYLIGEAVRGEGAILVNKNGERFVNELATRKRVTAAITALNENGAYLIFDQTVRQRVKAIEFYDKVGLVVTGASLAELATKLALPKENLSQTLSNWNQAVATRTDCQFGRKTGLVTLNQAPYYAIHIAPGIHYTMGGLHINAKTQVLDEDGQVISGLYAAGEVAGGLHGNNRIGGNSIAETVVFGLQAGKQAAKYILGK